MKKKDKKAIDAAIVLIKNALKKSEDKERLMVVIKELKSIKRKGNNNDFSEEMSLIKEIEGRIAVIYSKKTLSPLEKTQIDFVLYILNNAKNNLLSGNLKKKEALVVFRNAENRLKEFEEKSTGHK